MNDFNNSIVLGSYSKNWINDFIAGSSQRDVIPLEVLIAANAEWKNSQGKTMCILRSTSGITSIIASASTFVWMIMRSHDGLSTAQHRLLLGLCIFDIIYSLSFATFNIHAPSENNYKVWNARGNEATCDTQGFLSMLGSCGGLFYNVSLNIYFLVVVKYKKSEESIRTKIEPFLHAIPIVVGLSWSIVRLVKKQLNANSYGYCTLTVNIASHCTGYDVGEVREGFKIPCYRGVEGVGITPFIGMSWTIISAVSIIICLGMIYTTVWTQEKKLARYGAGALRANLQQAANSSR